MKKGDRGWINVAKLREMLVEIPGECYLTPIASSQLHISSADVTKKVALIDCNTETIAMEKEKVE